MIHGSVGVMPPWMAHQKVQFHSSGSQPETQRTERPQFHHGQGHGRPERMHRTDGADFTGRKHHGGGCLDQAACQTLFADRMRMDQRTEFRGQIMEIRHEVRHLMGSVEDGQLTTEQQTKFDGFVQDMIDLKEEFGIRRGHHANASDVGDRILNRFGVERAAVDCTCDGTVGDSPDADAATPATETPDETPDMAETAETPASCGDSHAAMETCSVEAACEATGPVVETPAQAPGVVDVDVAAVTVTIEETDTAAATAEVTAEVTSVVAETGISGGVSSEEVAKLVDQLASTIVDAEALIEELLKAIG